MESFMIRRMKNAGGTGYKGPPQSKFKRSITRTRPANGQDIVYVRVHQMKIPSATERDELSRPDGQNARGRNPVRLETPISRGGYGL